MGPGLDLHRHRRLRRLWVVVMDLPLVLWRAGLVAPFRPAAGKRAVPLVVLTHRGRTSGRRYHTALEVIDERAGAVVLCAFLGTRSDWMRNVEAGGLETIDLGRGPQTATWRPLSPDEARGALTRYRRRHAVWTRLVVPAMGWANGVPATVADLAGAVPLIEVTPTGTSPR